MFVVECRCTMHRARCIAPVCLMFVVECHCIMHRARRIARACLTFVVECHCTMHRARCIARACLTFVVECHCTMHRARCIICVCLMLAVDCLCTAYHALCVIYMCLTSVVEHHCTMHRAWYIIHAWCRWLHLELKSMSSTLRVALHCTMLQHTIWMQSEWGHVLLTSLHSISQHLRCDDCVEDRRGDYQNCVLLYSLQGRLRTGLLTFNTL